MSDLPIDPKINNSSRGAWLSSSDCNPGHDCPQRRTDHNRQTDGPTQKGEAVVATISLGGHAGEVAISPDGRQVYVIAADSVKVISHSEKQYYAALTDTPAQIIQKQSVKGIDAFTGATITSEAIINSTAKALSSGMK